MLRTATWIGVICFSAVVFSGEKMPREDVIEFPSIGEGLCVHNLFQTNMVLQRDKPISIWGWADAGEKVTVSFADKEQTATAAEDRSWKVTFPAMPANAAPVYNGADQLLATCQLTPW